MLRHLVVKELKVTLKDLRMLISVIIMPLMVFVVMGAVMSFAAEASIKAAKGLGQAIAVVNRDRGPYSALVLDTIRSMGYSVKPLEVEDVSSLIASGTNVTLVIEVPEGFSENMSSLRPATLVVHMNVRGLSMAGYSVYGLARSVTESVNKALSVALMKEAGVTEPGFVLNPVRSETALYVAGRRVPSALLGVMSFLTSGLMIAPLVVITTAIGVSAALIASENEERTLEVLLTLPIPRYKILAAKLLGVLVLVMLATVSYMAGFTYYISAPLKFVEEEAAELRPAAVSVESLTDLVGTHNLVLLGLSTFLSLVATSALGLLLGSLFPDVRTAQSYIGSLSLVVFVPGMVLMFVDISSLPLASQAALVAASPFISPVLVLKAAVEGVWWIPYASIAWALAFTAAMVGVSAKLLSSERILTMQFSIRMRRLRRARA